MKIIHAIRGGALGVFFSGCASIMALQENAKNVEIFNTPPAEIESCKYLGEVSGFEQYGWNARENIEGAINDIKNNVANLGGNVVVLLVNNADASGVFVGRAFFSSNSTALYGKAYLCER